MRVDEVDETCALRARPRSHKASKPLTASAAPLKRPGASWFRVGDHRHADLVRRHADLGGLRRFPSRRAGAIETVAHTVSAANPMIAATRAAPP